MTNTAAYDKIHAEENEYRYYTWLEDYLERLEGKEAYREFQDRYYDTPEYLDAEQGSNHWHGSKAVEMLRTTRYLVESLTGDGVPFDGKRYQLALDRARDAQDWDAYLYALRTYADAARAAYVDYSGL